MSRDNLDSKPKTVVYNCLTKNERYDLVTTTHIQTIGYIRTRRQTRKKNNQNKTKANYQKTIFKTTKRSLRIRNKHNTGTSRFKRINKKHNPIDDQI